MSLELKQYIKEALSQGASRDEISETLARSGWADAVIAKTLEQFVGVDGHGVPIPAPRMQAHQIARDLCVYSLILITLSLNSFALGALLFEFIDRYVKDVADATSYGDWGGWQVSWAIAQLLVAFPVFSILSYLVQRDVTKQPEKRESLIRKLMIYFILVLTAIVGLGDLIQCLTIFLQGEMTFRFLAKAGVVLGITQLIFGYYLFEMRRDDTLVRRAKDKPEA